MKIENCFLVTLVACLLVLSSLGAGYTIPATTIQGNLTLDNGALPSKIIGGDDNSDVLYLTSTSAATKGKIYFGTNSVFDEVNNRFGIGVVSPDASLKTSGGINAGTSVYSGTGYQSFAGGSAAVPLYKLKDDANTGMYQLFADTLAFSTGGTERLNLSSSGVSSPLPLMLGAVGTPTAPSGSDIKLYAANGVPYYRNASGSYIISGGAVSGGTGDVVGPVSSVADNIPVFASTSGKTLKDGSFKISELANNVTTFAAIGLKATKVYADGKINKSGDAMIGSLAMGAQKITGVCNGTGLQDAITHSQWQSAQSGGQVANIYYDDSRALAVAEWSNGTIIHQSINATSIQSALSNVDVTSIILKSYFDIGATTLICDRDISISGCGWSTGIYGSANPLIDFTTSTASRKVTVRDMKIATTSTNNGLYFHKVTMNAGASTAPNPFFAVSNILFYSADSTGSMIRIYGAKESTISRCVFYTNVEFPADGKNAIYISTDDGTSYGVYGIDIEGCVFYDVFRAVYAVGNTASGTYGAQFLEGLNIQGNTMVGCNYGLAILAANGCLIAHNMIDSNYYPAYFDSVHAFEVSDNYLGGMLNSANVLTIVNTYADSNFNIIHHNQILQYAVTKGKGIYFPTGGHFDASYNTIDHNMIRDQELGIQLEDSVAADHYKRYNLFDSNELYNCNYGIWLGLRADSNQALDNYATGGTTPLYQNNGATNYNRLLPTTWT
jgi:hypothetical protein